MKPHSQIQQKQEENVVGMLRMKNNNSSNIMTGMGVVNKVE
jgi:hypothetical protein